MLMVMRLRIPFSPLASVALFSLLCAITAYWALILLNQDAPVAPGAPVSSVAGPADAARTASLFGPAPAPAAAPTAAAAPVNIRILGVMAQAPARTQGRSGNAGVALVSIDGQPAKPYAVGDTLPNGMRVQAIRKDAVEFLDQGRLLSAPTPRESDTSVLIRGAAGPSTGASGSSPAPAGNAATPRTFGSALPTSPPVPQGGPGTDTAAPPPPPPPEAAGSGQQDSGAGR